jgi:hypothetical protein
VTIWCRSNLKLTPVSTSREATGQPRTQYPEASLDPTLHLPTWASRTCDNSYRVIRHSEMSDYTVIDVEAPSVPHLLGLIQY